MLFSASHVYAPGEPRGIEGSSEYQNVGKFGHYDLSVLRSPNVLIGLAGLVVLAYLLHRRGRRR